MKILLLLLSGILITSFSPPLTLESNSEFTRANADNSGIYRGELVLKKVKARRNFDCNAESSLLTTSFQFDQDSLMFPSGVMASMNSKNGRMKFLHLAEDEDISRKFIVTAIPRKGDSYRLTIREVARASRRACLFVYRGTFTGGELEPSA